MLYKFEMSEICIIWFNKFLKEYHGNGSYKYKNRQNEVYGSDLNIPQEQVTLRFKLASDRGRF
jgi:hypothetical protein